MLSLYREQLKAMARALDQEGLSQTAIGKELGVPQNTISRWLSQNNGQATQAIMDNIGGFIHNGLSTAVHPHYLVVCQWKEENKKKTGPKPGGISALRCAEIKDEGHPTRAEATEFFKVSRQKIDRASYVQKRNPDLAWHLIGVCICY